MRTLRRYRRSLPTPLIIALLILGLTSQTVTAGIISTQSVLEQQDNADRHAVVDLLDRQDLREQLAARGISPEQAEERLAQLTEEERLVLKDNIDALPAGSAHITLLLVLILLVLLLR